MALSVCTPAGGKGGSRIRQREKLAVMQVKKASDDSPGSFSEVSLIETRKISLYLSM